MITEFLLSKILLLLYISQPSDATKNVRHSADYEITQKQSEFERNAKKILGFERFLSKVRDMAKMAS